MERNKRKKESHLVNREPSPSIPDEQEEVKEWREYECKIDFRDNKSKSYSSLAVPPILRMYSFGVTPVLFLNERKKEARELKPQSSASAVKV